MNIKNATFYHITRPNPYQNIWTVGNTINLTQKQTNYFNAYYDNYYPQISIDNNLYPILQAIQIIQQNGLYNKPDDAKYIIEQMNLTIKEMAIYLRESIFEEIRSIYFPALPSRKYCIWVCEKNSIPYWQENLGGNFPIYELCLTGVMHRANPHYLDIEILPCEQIRVNAFNYWTGTDNNNSQEEILFEGIIEIKNKYNNYNEIP